MFQLRLNGFAGPMYILLVDQDSDLTIPVLLKASVGNTAALSKARLSIFTLGLSFLCVGDQIPDNIGCDTSNHS